MMDTRINLQPKQRRLKPILYAALALVLAALALDGVFGAHGLIASYRLRLQVRAAQQKTDRLGHENQELAGQAQQLKSDPSAIERVARQQMGLVKPNELVFKLPPKPSTDPNAAPAGKSGAAKPPPGSPPQR